MTDFSEPAGPQIRPLGDSPRLNYGLLKTDLRDLAATCAIEFYPAAGLNTFFITLTDVEYAALHLIVRDNAGDPVLDQHGLEQPIAREVLPNIPAIHAANATNAQVNIYEHDRALYKCVVLAITKLREKLLEAVGQTTRNMISTLDDGGIATKTLPRILLYLEQEYGTPTPEDLTVLHARLDAPFTTATAFPAESSQLLLNIAALTRGGDALSEAQKVRILKSAIANVAGTPSIVARYNRVHKAVTEQTLARLITMIKEDLPTSTITDMGYANSAGQSEMQILKQEVKELKNLLVKAGQAQGKNANGGRGGGRGGGGKGPGAGGGRHGGRLSGRGHTPTAAPPTTQAHGTRPYCFAHGHKGHVGTDCNLMYAESGYTEAMKKATGPCIIAGWVGSEE